MVIKLHQSVKQTQGLKMTPQLQMSINLLTLTHLEMIQTIGEQLVENPVLEEWGSEEYNEQNDDLEFNSDSVDEVAFNREEGTISETKSIEDVSEDYNWTKFIENDDYVPTQHALKSGQVSSEERPNFENFLSKGPTLADHLELQIRMQKLTQNQYLIADTIIRNLDNRGRLNITLSELAQETHQNEDDCLDVLLHIQHMDPIGCASRSLAECLLVQAHYLRPRNKLVERILKDHLDDIEETDIFKLAKKLDVKVEELAEAKDLLKTLNPNPGWQVSNDRTEYVIPDIFVKFTGNDIQINLNDDSLPKIRISNYYRNILDSNLPDLNTKKYIKGKVQDASWFLSSYRTRQNTILNVAKTIIERQTNFFRKGPDYLVPMVLRDVANELGVNESTVSRAVTNKYMDTPLGVFELKYFFNVGLGGKDGGASVAPFLLKKKIKMMVDREDPRRPLSDQRIVEILKEDNIDVARRTIAKYREALEIPSSAKRRAQYTSNRLRQ